MTLAKTILIAFCVVGAAGGVAVHGQAITKRETFTQITQQEISLLLAAIGETNPQMLERLKEDPELRRLQIQNLRELLAFASEAQKSGLADEQRYRIELDSIRAEVAAVIYDKHINKDKPPVAPFGYITDAALSAYWGDAPGSTLSPALKAARKTKFEQFFDTKVYLLRTASPGMKDRAITEEEKKQARYLFAKIQIYADEYAKRSATLPLSFRQQIDLQIKLQQAQFLARLYAEKMAPDVAASDDEIATYLRAHPEMDTAAQRAKAEKILARAKNGEDFAKLANEFSEDPGNKNQQNELQGGLYTNISKGVFVPPFEKAALALDPGQISPQLVETDFGFHIVKLESKSGDKYDVRHILIATAGNPSSSEGRKEDIKKEVESEKERVIIDRLIVSNKISIPEDLVIPSAAPKSEPVKATPKRKPRATRKRT